MNDTERDAWLREALRHAPDSDALPPSGVSEAILLKARAAARAAAPAARRAGSRDAHANPLTALWDWLARPPVAAGFASVMAATLVGLMWWDRPMDEGMPRSPAMTSDRAPAAAAPAPPSTTAETAPLASTAQAPAAAIPATPTEATKSTPDARPTNDAAQNATTDEGAVRRRQRSAPEQAGAIDAKVAAPGAAPAPRGVDPLAKERALPAEKKSEAPAPFPSTEMQRETLSSRKSLDAAAANDASKKDVEVPRSRATDWVERAAGPAAARPVAPPPAMPSPAVGAVEPAPQAPLAGGRLGDERGAAAPAENAVAAKAKSAVAAPAVPAAPAAATPPVPTLPATPAAPAPVPTAAAPAAVAAAPTRDAADAPRFQQAPSAFGGMRENDAASLASSSPLASAAPTPFRAESPRSGPEARWRADASARTVAPARLLAAIAGEPERWLRQTAGGNSVALDAGWRAWLAELDAAAAGRWQPLGVTPPENGAATPDAATTTLRLVNAGRVAAIVRFDGTRVQVDAAPGTGTDRWQATLVPAGAERLRSTARRLSP